MTKKHSTKRSLIASILILCLCITSLVGTTFAWFTDEVTSSGNKIVAGSLKVDLELLDKKSGNWNSLKDNHDPIFTYENWEPGYIDAKILKVDNEGSLALKWKAKFTSTNELGELANVIDVYVLPYGVLSAEDAATKVAYPTRELKDYTRVGTLSEFVNTIESTTYGNLLAGESAYLGIALKMQESAGNEYQEKTIGTFDIQIVATQMAHENDSFGNDYDAGAEFFGEVTNPAGLQAAINNGGNVKLTESITLEAPVVVPEGTSVVLDLNGKSLTANDSTYAINNHGTLVLMDSSKASMRTYSAAPAASVAARGIYNGYSADGNHVTDAKLTILSGVYNALANNGGAAIFNYGIVEVKGGTFNSNNRYTISNLPSGKMTIDDAVITNGIYNEGELTVNGGEIATTRGGSSHAIYHIGPSLTINDGIFSGNGNEVIQANSAPAVINGGTFTKVEKTSYLIGGSKLVINDGNFFAHESNPAGHPVRPDVVINGGNFNYKPSVSSDYVVIDHGDGTWGVYSPSGETVTLADGAVLDLKGTEFNGTIIAEGDLSIKGDTKIKTLKAINGGTISIEDGKTLTLNNFSFGALETAGSEYVITGGTVVAAYGFFQHGTYALESDFETGYMYYSYGSDITVYGTFHSKGAGDGLDYVRGTLTIADGGKSIHDGSLWVGDNPSWANAAIGTLIIADGGYVQAKSLVVHAGSTLIVDVNNIIDEDESTGYKATAETIEGTVKYMASDVASFKAALKNQYSFIVIGNDITITEDWDYRDYSDTADYALFKNPVVIDGMGNTLKFTGKIYGGGNYECVFRFENTATVKNLTMDMSEVVFAVAPQVRAISSSADLTVDNCTFIGPNDVAITKDQAIKFGDTNAAKQINATVVINDCTFIGWERGVSDNENAKEVKSATITNCTFDNSAAIISAYESVTFTGNETIGAISRLDIRSYTAADTATAVAIDNILDANAEKAIEKLDPANVTAQDDIVVR